MIVKNIGKSNEYGYFWRVIAQYFYVDWGSMNNSNIDYDISDEQSIIEYASKLVGHSLREVTNVEVLADHKKRRGAFGNAVEEFYFKYPILFK